MSVAQDSLRTGIKYGGLPWVSFNSDQGAIIGAEVTRYNYGKILPFKNLSKIALIYDTNGAFVVEYLRDEVNFLDTNLRVSYDVKTIQNKAEYYVGDTELQEVNMALFEAGEYYHFNSFELNMGIKTRFPVYMGEGISRTDFGIGLRYIYKTPWGVPEGRFINSSSIIGNSATVLSLVEGEFLVERRNSEFRPTKGYLFKIGFKGAPPIISTYSTIQNYAFFYGFVPVTQKTTFASRVKLANTIGDSPFWFKPLLGGIGSTRGMQYARYVSDNSFSYSAEIRTWFLEIPFKNIELGGTAFIDRGRVFTNENWGGMFSNHKVALGLGGVMSIFTPDFILKCEMGFSEGRTAIYLGTGYSF